MLKACLTRVRKSRYDVVHAVEESVFITLLCKWIFGVPCVYDMDSGLARQMMDRFPWLRPARFLLDACERLAVRASSGTLAGCRALAIQARAWDPRGLIAPLEDVSFVEPEPGAMGKGMVQLLNDEVLRERLAANARQLVQRNFTMDAFRRKFLTFYDALEERIGRIGNDGKHHGSTERIEARHQGHG